MSRKIPWLTPIMIVLALFAFLILLIEGLPNAFSSVSWSTMSPTFIEIFPWIIALGVALATFVYVVRK